MNTNLMREIPGHLRTYNAIPVTKESFARIERINAEFLRSMESPYVGQGKSSPVVTGVMASAGPNPARARAIAAMLKAVPTRSPKIRKNRAQGQGVKATSDRESPVALLVAAGKRAHRTRRL